MQSQQKKVKWSRGETASALEERTDTGITNVSVARMENCIADIYGNISRRPALKIRSDATPVWLGGYVNSKQGVNSFVFSVEANKYFILVQSANTLVSGWLIQNNKVVKSVEVDVSGITDYYVRPGIPSVCQFNNYMVCFNLLGRACVITYDPNTESLKASTWKYSGPWYAPAGTKESEVTNAQIAGLEFNKDKKGFVQYTYTDIDGVNVYYSVDTGLAPTQANWTALKDAIPLGSIVQFPNTGAYMRVEGYYGYSPARMPVMATAIGIFGELLAPAVDETVTDTAVKVTYGFEKIDSQNFYYPSVGTFQNQRLWVSGLSTNQNPMTPGVGDQQFLPGYVLGSHIARYTDFKNNYNQPNEPIALELTTTYQEKVNHLVDFQGLKIFTDVGEYAYDGASVVAQSQNGAAPTCRPIIFNSILVYLDKNQRYVRALQYEFQQNVFASSTINEMAPADLVWNPTVFNKTYDKEHHTGNFLYALQPRPDIVEGVLPLQETYSKTSCSMVCCNLTPANQNIIWGRWNFPKILHSTGSSAQPTFLGESVVSCISMNNKLWCITRAKALQGDTDFGTLLLLAELDHDGNMDYEVGATPSTTVYSVGSVTLANVNTLAVFPNAAVSIFDNGVWQTDATTNAKGELSVSLAGMTNPSIGFMINATLDSHPIDIGGKTKSVVKRISKAIMAVRDTEPGAITINNKTGYMNPTKDMISFYGVTGMKREITYKVTNIKGAKFHLESLLLNLEYGTLIS